MSDDQVDERPSLVVEFQAPAVPQSINALKGQHGAAWSRQMKPWKDLAWVHAHNHRVRAHVPWTGHRAIRVQVALPFSRAGRRDPHNYTGTVVKAIVDGLVQAQIVPDDTAEWVEVMDPSFIIGPDRTVRVTITERNPRRD